MKKIDLIGVTMLDPGLECTSCGEMGSLARTGEVQERGEYETCDEHVCLACGMAYYFSATCGEWGHQRRPTHETKMP